MIFFPKKGRGYGALQLQDSVVETQWVEIKIKNNKTIIVVKGPLPPSREGRGATF
jgi:hypothetical protein